jgi:hypothetical protein
MDPDDAMTISTILQDLEIPAKELTKWEQSFIESITDQWETKGDLSDRQYEILVRIHKEKG